MFVLQIIHFNVLCYDVLNKWRDFGSGIFFPPSLFPSISNDLALASVFLWTVAFFFFFFGNALGKGKKIQSAKGTVKATL